MSKIKIEGNASGTGTLTIAAPNTNTDRTLTLPDGAGEILTNASSLPAANLTGTLPAIDGSALTNLPGGGKVLQVVTNVYTSQTTVAINTEHTGPSASITPSSTSSKILILGTLSISESSGDLHIKLKRDGSDFARGTAVGNATRAFTGGSTGRSAWDVNGVGLCFLDSPGTTSAVTYSAGGICTNGGWAINKQFNGNQNATNDNSNISTIVLMEIAG